MRVCITGSEEVTNFSIEKAVKLLGISPHLFITTDSEKGIDKLVRNYAKDKLIPVRISDKGSLLIGADGLILIIKNANDHAHLIEWSKNIGLKILIVIEDGEQWRIKEG